MGEEVKRWRGSSALEGDRQIGARTTIVFLGVQTKVWVKAGRLFIRTWDQKIVTGEHYNRKCLEYFCCTCFADLYDNFLTGR